jgi:hypothetical protein
VIIILDTIIIQVVIAVIVLIIGLIISHRRILRCIVVPALALVNVSKDVQKKTIIKYDDQVVDNLSSTILLIRNSSWTGLTDEDFVNNLRITFDENIKLLEYEVLFRKNPDRIAEVAISNNEAVVEKIQLLNRFESIIFRFIHHGIPKIDFPVVKGDIKNYKIKTLPGVIKGKREADFMYVDGLFQIFLGFSMLILCGLISLDLFTSDIEPSISYYVLVGAFIILSIVSIPLLIRGIKRIYHYITRVVELD